MNTPPHRFTDTKVVEILSLSQNATAIYTGDDIIIQTANDSMIRFWGKTKSVIGRPLVEAVPELVGQPFVEILKNVWRTGISYESKDAAAELKIDGTLQTFYFDFSYRAILGENGVMDCILHTATDVTEFNLNREILANAKAHKDSLDKEQALNEVLNDANEKLNLLNKELKSTQDVLQLLNDQLEERVAFRTKELLISEAKFRALIEHSPIAMQVFRGENMVFEIVNEAMLQFLGKTADIIGLPLFDGVPEIVGQPIVEQLYQVYHTGEPLEIIGIEVMLNRNNKNEVGYYNVSYRALYDDDMVTGVLGIAIDVTEQVRTQLEVQNLNEELSEVNKEVTSFNKELSVLNEELLKSQKELSAANTLLIESEEKLKLAIDTGRMGTWSISLDTMKISVSEFVKNLLGLPLDKDPGMDLIMKAIDPEYHMLVQKALNDAIYQHLPTDIDYSIHNLNTNEQKWVRVTGRVFAAVDGKPAQYTGMFIDITEQKQDEQRKNDFIGMVSHELKTPLTSLTAYVQLLQVRAKKTEDSFTTGALERANKQVKSMTAMINGFLNVSRLESGKLHIDYQVFDMADLVKEVEEEATLMITSHQVVFAPVMPTIIKADKNKIGQVINNFISNAVKYSPAGSIINVACITVHNMAQLSVQDRGVGIEPQDINKLFERYYRVEGKQAMSIAGFGIGLYLCDEILQRHDGKIWVESKVGAGSTFYFSLPLEGAQ
jgi:two-component system sensor histidine kinase VicK